MTILNLNTDVLPFLELSSDDSFGNVSVTHNYVEQFVKTFTNRNLEEASYKEVYRPRLSTVSVRNRPIVSIEKISIDRVNTINILNTNVSTTALVTITNTGINLNRDGTVTTLTFASNPTITDLVTAINGVGLGWVATLPQSKFAPFLSTELLKTPALETINNTTVQLFMAGQSLSEYDIDEDNGLIFLRPFSVSSLIHTHSIHGNHHYRHMFPGNMIFSDIQLHLSYTAGYSAANMPNDLKTAMLMTIKFVYQKLTTETLGVKALSTASLKVVFEGSSQGGASLQTAAAGRSGFPNEAISVFEKYREISI